MALETGTYISDLNSANPTSGDPKSEGDDHLRLIKGTIKNTFPNVSGAVNATQAQLNQLATGAINSTSIGATTPSTGAFTTLSATGIFSNTSASTNSIQISGATTNGSYQSFTNTGGSTIIGINNSTASLVGGSTAYASFVGSNTATNLDLLYNGSSKATISSTGLAVTGTLSSTGNTTLGDASTDTVTVNGYMGVGGAPNSAAGIDVVSTALAGANQYGVFARPVATSGATSTIQALVAQPRTAAASFTVSESIGLQVTDATKGAGSTITTQYGIWVRDQTQGTNNYGITSAVSSGTNKWNIYASGTAESYFNGGVSIGLVGLANYYVTGSKLAVNQAAGNAIQASVASAGTPTAITVLNGGNQAADRGIAIDLYSPGDGLGVSGARATARLISAGASATTQGGYLRFDTENTSGTLTERMRIDYAGNVGIGTSTPSTRLHLKNADDGTDLTIRLDHGDTSLTTDQQIGAVEVYSNDPSGAGVGVKGALRIRSSDATGTSSYLTLSTSSTTVNDVERLRIDSSGNLGLGVTPSGWGGSYKALQFGQLASINAISTVTALGNNYYHNGTSPVRISAQEASVYSQNAGSHVWYTAPTGTAGSTFSWTAAMTLDASGNVGLGVTPSAWTSGIKVVELGNAGNALVGGLASNAWIVSNVIFDSGSTQKYAGTQAATGYQQYQGVHKWFTAPSGTAGTAITFTQSLAVGKGTSLALEGATSAAGTGIAFPATQLASTDPNTLDNYKEGSFFGTATGMTTSPTNTISYTLIGNAVIMNIGAVFGTSNAVTFTLTGVPTELRPSSARAVCVRVQDNGVVQPGFTLGVIETTGVITLYKDATGGVGFTASGTKGIATSSVSYTL